MLIKKSETQKIEITSNCTVWEYNYPSDHFSLATALINGRYPDQGKSINEQCEQAYYVISGHGVVHSDKGDYTISNGDLYYFEPKEAYYIESNNLLVVLINAPKWTAEQYKHIN
ncbi:MAG: hypothetical protein V1765_01560 [bacterium]